ncbi:MAG: tryptophanase [Thermotogae bacterium]|nr:tryptophanase [Thermotogota bacterium]
MRYPVEPFRIKVVEPINLPSPEERERLLVEAKYNLFKIPSEKVFIDFLTDSGTGALSHHQWAAMMEADESYAGSRSWFRLKRAIEEFSGYEDPIPVHQGRAAEKLLATIYLHEGAKVVSNTLFDTTRGNFLAVGAEIYDIPTPEALDISSDYPFKGNIDLNRLEELLKEGGVKLVVMVLTNNTGGGQPVDLDNLKEAYALTQRYGVPLIIDACRIAENAYFVKRRNPKYSGWSVKDIVLESFRYSDGAFMSGKKDGLSNMGGFLVLRDERKRMRAKELLILWEGFIHYGGLSGRDMESMAVGLKESLDERYLEHRTGQVAYLTEGIREIGWDVMWPPGGHAAYIEVSEALAHIPKEQFPAHSLVVELYRRGAIRTVEVGSLMFKDAARYEFVRFAIPRRMYSRAHLDYTLDVLRDIYASKGNLRGFRITYEPPHLRHFLAELEPIL